MILRSKNEKINKKLAEGLPQGQNGTLKLSRKLGVLDSWKAPYMIGAAILKPWTSFSMIYSIVNSLKTDQFYLFTF